MEKKQEPQKASAWTIKKEISLGDLIAFAMAALSVIYAYTTLDKRLSILEDRKSFQDAVDEKQDSTAAEQFKELKEQMKDINSKLDRALEARRIQ